MLSIFTLSLTSVCSERVSHTDQLALLHLRSLCVFMLAALLQVDAK